MSHVSRFTLAAIPLQLIVLAGVAAAQPTAEQQSALRNNCRSDFMSNCSGVTPGGAEALQCLQSHSAELSANCRGALALFNPNSATPAAAISEPAANPTPAAPAAAPRPAQPARAATVKPATAPAAAAPSHQPTQQQRDAIRASCRSDFMARCPGVQPGGADALRCLQRNAPQLSSSCKNAVAAVSGGAPAAQTATAVAAPATAAPAAMPSQQQQSAIKAACQRDFMFNCRGVTPGGPEAFACLQRNSSRLSPACQSALAAVAGGAQAAAAAPATEPSPAMRPGPVGPLRRALRERMMMGQ